MTAKSKIASLPLLALLSAFGPLSTDMYLPALPTLAQNWQESLSIINLTLVCFFITYGLFLLVYGPLSDRFGRRPLLLFGIGIYILASLLCALAGGAAHLIIFRLFQGAGAASATALAMAITKDLYDGKRRAQILAHIAIIMSLAPIIGPVFGGWILTWLSWPWVFACQASMGTAAFAGVYRMRETLKHPSRISLIRLGGNYLRLVRNGRYIGLTLLMTLSAIPFFAFIGGAPDIYITRLGLSEQAFGYFFGFNAMALMAGAFTFTRLQRFFPSRHLLTGCFAGSLIGGLWLLFAGHGGPWSLALPMFAISFAGGMSRPPSNSLILDQVDRDAGSASALLIFTHMIFGSMAMWMISWDWQDKITVLGFMGSVCGAVLLCGWLCLQRFVFTASRAPS